MVLLVSLLAIELAVADGRAGMDVSTSICPA
jgi:hypothetical protein